MWKRRKARIFLFEDLDGWPQRLRLYFFFIFGINDHALTLNRRFWAFENALPHTQTKLTSRTSEYKFDKKVFFDKISNPIMKLMQVLFQKISIEICFFYHHLLWCIGGKNSIQKSCIANYRGPRIDPCGIPMC